MKKSMVLFVLLFSGLTAMAQQKVLIMEIKDVIDPRMNRYVELALLDAEATQTDIVIIEMDTYGGVLTDAKEIVDKIMHFKKPVWVFINSDAASAGALISIACDSIYMAPGASIGAATVVDGQGDKAPDKYQSYMRSIMRSTAEENGRDTRIAEGMVDEDIVIDGIKEAGQIITFSTSEALEHGFCEARVESIQEILERNHVKDYTIRTFELGLTERIISIALNPFISSILILIIIAGIYFEMQTPGLGFAGLAALVALVFYLVPYYLNGLAANWEIIVFFVGLGLIAVEIFVLPGFGVAGVSGIVLTVGSLFLIMINNDAFDFEFVPKNDLVYALTAAVGGTLGGMILLFVAGSKLPETRFFRHVALTDTQDRSEGYVSFQLGEPLMGKKGIAETVLRPSGKVLIDDKMYDATTRGEYIQKGQAVEVISEEGSSLKVKLVS
ncbi:MAG: ATP-dependent Clp protease proteolytic subunit [Bacteroidota bacterium]|nr:ATP-dependent Clp protease proteolytic subunit [Bacteroidota bacterium]